MKKIKLVLLDDHQIVRDGIKALLKDHPIIEVIGEAEDCYSFFELLKTDLPHVVVMDISLPKMSGIEVCGRLKKEHPQIRIIMLSMYTSEDFIFNALKAGASAYLPKNTTEVELISAIYQVHAGKEYLSQSISNVIMQSYIKKAKNGNGINVREEVLLTPRETEVLKLIAEGFQNSEIGEKLFISPRTVETHRMHILSKLELNSTVDLVKYAIRNKLIEI